jgi:hypothetical protein
MTTPSFDPPSPSFDPSGPFVAGGPPPSIVRAPVPQRRRWLPVVGAIILAAVAFAGGFAVANATATKVTTATGNGGNAANGQGFGPGASGRPRGGGFGGGATGTVGSVASDQMTITTAAGGQRIVLLTPTTTVTEVTSATKTVTDLKAGQTVTVVGTSNPDGSVTATNVVVGNVGAFGGRGGFGGPGGDNPSASPAP